MLIPNWNAANSDTTAFTSSLGTAREISCCSAVKGAAGCSGIIKGSCAACTWPATHTEAIAITGNNLISFISSPLLKRPPQSYFIYHTLDIISLGTVIPIEIPILSMVNLLIQ